VQRCIRDDKRSTPPRNLDDAAVRFGEPLSASRMKLASQKLFREYPFIRTHNSVALRGHTDGTFGAPRPFGRNARQTDGATLRLSVTIAREVHLAVRPMTEQGLLVIGQPAKSGIYLGASRSALASRKEAPCRFAEKA
jgi:hypothetical protein